MNEQEIPYIVIFSTITVDGRLASVSGFSRLSCPHDKKRQMMLRCNSDAIIVGGNTVRIDDPLLTVRDVKCDKMPMRVILSHSLNFNERSKIFKQPPKTIIYTDIERKAKVPDDVEVVNFRPLSICSVMKNLHERGVRKVLVEGGGTIIYNTVRENCFDELRVTISPRLFGNGVNLLNGAGFTDDSIVKLSLVDAKLCECGEEVHLVYKKLT